jgi:hypothetical protein
MAPGWHHGGLGDERMLNECALKLERTEAIVGALKTSSVRPT